MRRKDYIVIANAMMEQITCKYVKKCDRQSFIDMMSGYLKNDNNRFDEYKFYDYIMKGVEAYEQ